MKQEREGYLFLLYHFLPRQQFQIRRKWPKPTTTAAGCLHVFVFVVLFVNDVVLGLGLNVRLGQDLLVFRLSLVPIYIQ